MSDEEIRKRAEARRKHEIEARMLAGVLETKDGKRIYPSPDKKQYGIIPRTISEKLNYTLLLQKQIDNCEFVAQYSYDAFARSVIVLLNMIPEEDQDEKFEEEVANATFKVKVPTGRYGGFGGSTYEIMHEAIEYDHLKIFRACINLLRRRGLYETPKLWDETRHEVIWSEKGE